MQIKYRARGRVSSSDKENSEADANVAQIQILKQHVFLFASYLRRTARSAQVLRLAQEQNRSRRLICLVSRRAFRCS